jgi:hypothetical protein
MRTLLLTLALAGCAQLSAEAPLFSVADQPSEPPIVEGVWLVLGEGCPAENLTRSNNFSPPCEPMQITREPDGAWSARQRPDLVAGPTPEERAAPEQPREIRFLLVPAVERPLGAGQSTAFVAELQPPAPGDSTAYVIAVPTGALPAASLFILSGIGCADALADGPIADVEPLYTERAGPAGETTRELSGCVASTQAAVREAARRTLIANADELSEQRLVLAPQAR